MVIHLDCLWQVIVIEIGIRLDPFQEHGCCTGLCSFSREPAAKVNQGAPSLLSLQGCLLRLFSCGAVMKTRSSPGILLGGIDQVKTTYPYVAIKKADREHGGYPMDRFCYERNGRRAYFPQPEDMPAEVTFPPYLKGTRLEEAQQAYQRKKPNIRFLPNCAKAEFSKVTKGILPWIAFQLQLTIYSFFTAFQMNLTMGWRWTSLSQVNMKPFVAIINLR
ncbi:hypothetical protein SELMODRAFT_409113 [Selaginella moellendorffii]|uniref:Uncharacterized protein n=1 Tax=Selaginella moellendorffii TaxID=88036 RepID=D8RAE5_SELML|nr:hypothetical protein SELMODRAFT_409113 [Selaginella moellendorffii]